ncbi:unnamed protein product, partial [marine sediment metagenome]
LMKATEDAEITGGSVNIEHNMREAVQGADAINIYSWVSPEQYKTIKKTGKLDILPHVKNPEEYKKWIVTKDLVDLAKRDAVVMHCLPASRGEQVTDEVLDGPKSIIFDEAENRLHVQKALLSLLIK